MKKSLKRVSLVFMAIILVATNMAVSGATILGTDNGLLFVSDGCDSEAMLAADSISCDFGVWSRPDPENHQNYLNQLAFQWDDGGAIIPVNNTYSDVNPPSVTYNTKNTNSLVATVYAAKDYGVGDWSFYGSNDKSQWTEIEDVIKESCLSDTYTSEKIDYIANYASYDYVKIVFPTVGTGLDDAWYTRLGNVAIYSKSIKLGTSVYKDECGPMSSFIVDYNQEWWNWPLPAAYLPLEDSGTYVLNGDDGNGGIVDFTDPVRYLTYELKGADSMLFTVYDNLPFVWRFYGSHQLNSGFTEVSAIDIKETLTMGSTKHQFYVSGLENYEYVKAELSSENLTSTAHIWSALISEIEFFKTNSAMTLGDVIYTDNCEMDGPQYADAINQYPPYVVDKYEYDFGVWYDLEDLGMYVPADVQDSIPYLSYRLFEGTAGITMTAYNNWSETRYVFYGGVDGLDGIDWEEAPSICSITERESFDMQVYDVDLSGYDYVMIEFPEVNSTNIFWGNRIDKIEYKAAAAVTDAFEEVSFLDMTISDGEFSISIKNSSDTRFSGPVLVAVYEDNRLVDVVYKEMVLMPCGYYGSEASFNGSVDTTGVTRAQLMFMDSFSLLSPFGAAQEITVVSP